MAIVAADILFKLSVTTGPGNSAAQADPNLSLGEFISTTAITDATLHNLFDVVTGDDNAASDVEYRLFFIHNAHATLTWQAPKVWLSAETAGGANIAISVDTTAASALANASAQAKEVANEDTAPTAQTFSSPTTKATGLAVSDIAAGQVKGIWVRRTAANSAALDNDDVTLTVEGDTSA